MSALHFRLYIDLTHSLGSKSVFEYRESTCISTRRRTLKLSLAALSCEVYCSSRRPHILCRIGYASTRRKSFFISSSLSRAVTKLQIVRFHWKMKINCKNIFVTFLSLLRCVSKIHEHITRGQSNLAKAALRDIETPV